MVMVEIVFEESAGGEQVEETAEAAAQDDLAWFGVLAGNPATKAGQQLDLFPLEGGTPFEKESGSNGSEGDQEADRL